MGEYDDLVRRLRKLGGHGFPNWADDAADAIEALAAENARLREERDRFEAALARACLVGGATYLIERAEKAEAENARMRREISEATHPDFIWGALDNVHDAETTLDDYAAAVSRAQRAALAATPLATKPVDASKPAETDVKKECPKCGGARFVSFWGSLITCSRCGGTGKAGGAA